MRPTVPASRPGRLARVAVVLGLVVVALLVAAAGALHWLRTGPGLAWAVAHVPGLTLDGMTGRPDGGAFAAERLRWQSATLTVTVDKLAWRDLQWRWRPYRGAWLGITVVEPQAQRVLVQTRPGPAAPDASPATPPQALALPLELVLRRLQVGSLQVNTLPPIEALTADLHLGADGGAVHRVSRLEARVRQWQTRANLSVGAHGDLALAGEVAVASLPGATQPVDGRVALSGTVGRPQLKVQAAVGANARLQADATLAPFAAWPLLDLQASMQALDLSALSPGLPGTRLSGSASVTGGSGGQPLAATVDITNGLPGPWSELRLPLRGLHAIVQGDPSAASTVDIKTLDLQLEGNRPAGRVQGSGRWRGHALSLDLALDGVRVAQLHTAASPATLGGPMRLQLEGLPSPDPAANRAAAPAAFGASLHTDLRGRLDRRRSQPVRMALDGSLALPADGSLLVRDVQATLTSGGARATLTASAQRDPQGTWQARSTGELARFDPSDWWAGPDDALQWRRGPNALNGSWKAKLALAPPPQRTAAATSAPAVPLRERLLALVADADADLDLHDSRLAGVPLRAAVTLKAGGRALRLDGDLRAASARTTLAVSLGANAADDHGQIKLDAPTLAALRPLFALLPGSAAWAPRSGSLQATASASGAWPSVRTEGEAQARRIDGGGWRLGRADARWSAATADVNAPLSLTLDAAELTRGEQRIDHAEATLAGTLREHRFNLLVSSPLRPPAWTDAALAQGEAPPRGGRLSLGGAGRWQAAAPGGGTWRGTVAELRAAPAGAGATPWVQARDLQASVRVNAGGALAGAELAPDAIELLGATLQVRQAAYEAPTAAGGSPRLQLDVQLEPLPVAPWLARLQPHMGWSGDLRIGGHVRARSTQGFEADVLIERQGGDLQLSSAAGPHRLGLDALRLAATARHGTWQLSELVRGSGVGEATGAQTLRTGAQATLPTAEAALDGQLQLRVADLAPWSAWLPAGWRVGGRLQADATLGGRLGEPQYRGHVSGSGLAVANLLQGVDLSDGVLALSLQGDRATLERLQFKGGEGSLVAKGSARFGATPQAQLQVAADHLLALGRVDRRIVMSGQAGLRLDAQDINLDGRFTVDQGRIDISQADAPKLDDDVTVVDIGPGAQAPQAPDAAQPAGLLGRAEVALEVDLGQDLRLRGRGLDTLLKGRLRITNPDGVLAVNGTLRTDDGTYTAYGQNLAIERGIIRFDGEIGTPRLDILAVRPDIDVRVGVAVQGSAADPRVRLYSEPEMNEMDKLSWLVMGRAPEGMDRAQTALLQRAALALLAGERGNPSGGFVQKLGLDELSVARGASGDVRDTVVTLGKQLSKRWFVAYERGLNAAAGSWQLIYRVARRFTLRAQSGDDSAVDVIWTWRWNGNARPREARDG